MYRPESHTRLLSIVNSLEFSLSEAEMQPFLLRLAANFEQIEQLFFELYAQRAQAEDKLQQLIATLASSYQARRASLRSLDQAREAEPDWFLSQNWVGMALYCDRFAGGLGGVVDKVDYLDELGVNMMHIMPMMHCPQGANDGGYAISDFRQVDQRFGTLDDVAALSSKLRRKDMLLTLDVVINHSSDEHEWAQRARAGEARYQDYFYRYPDRAMPDLFEQSMPEVFPETAPGSFTFDPELNEWVMTVFNNYQWDLNYRNPDVLIEMIDIILYWANQGADILRLDAPAFIWKELGTSCQNLPQAHTILQLFKRCGQLVCPGVLFIAEAIVAPKDIVKYFAKGAEYPECEIAYNATLMALIWDAVATQNARVLTQGMRSLPSKPARTTWLNYLRCHDDIGLGFEDADIAAAGFEPRAHRRFLVEYLTGQFAGSTARGAPFGANDKTGDARISGSLAALAGLEAAVVAQDHPRIQQSIQRMLSLHALIMAWGGISLLYYGDELASLNDHSYLDNPDQAPDNRWMHRPIIDWDGTAAQRHQQGTREQVMFSGLQHLIRCRKAEPVLADFNNRQLLWCDNAHLFCFASVDPKGLHSPLVVVINFENRSHYLNLDNLRAQGFLHQPKLINVITQEPLLSAQSHLLEIPAYQCYWLR